MRSENEINDEYTKTALALGDLVFRAFNLIKKMSDLDSEIRRTIQERKINETDSD